MSQIANLHVFLDTLEKEKIDLTAQVEDLSAQLAA